MVLLWLKKHWLEVAAGVLIFIIGFTLGFRLGRAMKPSVKPVETPANKDTQDLLKEANDLLKEIERRQAERQKAAEGLK